MKTVVILSIASILILGAFFILVDLQEDECDGYRGKVVTDSLYSQLLKDRFKIAVYLPRSYSETDAVRYPVIYQLDGNYYGKTTAILMAHFSCRGTVPTEAIVVAIGYYYDGWYDRRERDFIYAGPSIDEGDSTSTGINKGMHFFYFLKNELIPYIDTHFKTDNTVYGRTLMGHSLGAYFTLFAMFYQCYAAEADTGRENEHLLFTNFLAASPVVVNEWRYLFILEEKLRKKGITRLPLSVFMSTSDIEEKTPIKYFPVLVNRLRRWAFPGFRVRAYTLKNLLHTKTAVPGYMEGIPFIFNPPPPAHRDR